MMTWTRTLFVFIYEGIILLHFSPLQKYTYHTARSPVAAEEIYSQDSDSTLSEVVSRTSTDEWKAFANSALAEWKGFIALGTTVITYVYKSNCSGMKQLLTSTLQGSVHSHSSRQSAARFDNRGRWIFCLHGGHHRDNTVIVLHGVHEAFAEPKSRLCESSNTILGHSAVLNYSTVRKCSRNDLSAHPYAYYRQSDPCLDGLVGHLRTVSMQWQHVD